MTGSEEPLRFALLGSVRAWRGERELRLGGPRQRSVLAVLLLRAGRAVPRGQLVRAVWGEPAPQYCVNQLQKYVSALRRVLEPERAARAPAGILNWSDSGYVLDVGPEATDLAAFERAVAGGRAARSGGDTERAAAEFAAALDLWQGPVLANVSSGDLDAERARLEEVRAAVLEERIGADLDLGRHRRVVPELTRLTADFPLRERLAALLMLALHRSGRPDDALNAYQRLRRDLREEIGADPGGEVRDLQARILAGEVGSVPFLRSTGPTTACAADATVVTDTTAGTDTADVTETAEATGTAEVTGTAAVTGTAHVDQEPAPGRRIRECRQLPMDIPHFVGRTDPLRALRELVGDRGAAADPGDAGVLIAVIEGMAGAGKTRLALHAAHRLVAAGHFTDVQLWADLLGLSSDRGPAEPADVLEDFLRLLGVPAHLVPERTEARAALYRDRLAGRRVLLVLDDAADAEQVRHLLPGSSSALVLVTSRRALTAVDAAHTVRLGPLPPDEAVALFRHAAGPDRAGAGPAPGRVAALCGHLPLAVALAGRRLRARPSWSAADLADRLADGAGRLYRLAGGQEAVAAAFGLSYRQLPDDLRRAFRLLALHPGEDCTPASAAALLDTDPDTAEDALEALLDEHLLEQRSRDRYRHHALLRLYALERTRAEDADEQRQAAVARLVHWYRDRAEAARLTLEPGHRHRLRRAAANTGRGAARHVRRGAGQAPADPGTELRWLEGERANLLAVSRVAAEHGWHEDTWRLAAAAHSFLGLHSFGSDSLAGLRLGLAAARHAGDRAQQGHLMCDLGHVYDAVGRHREAEVQHSRALGHFEELGDVRGAAEALNGLGHSSGARGRYRESRRWHGMALVRFREAGDRYGEARATAGLGMADWFVRGHDESAAHHRQALALLQETGDRRTFARELVNVGLAHWFYGEYAECARRHRRALTLFEEDQDRRGQACAHHGLGLAAWHLGDLEGALGHHRFALSVFRDLSDRRGEALTVQRLGYIHWMAGRYEEGERELRRSLDLCARTENRNTEAWALTSLGFLCQRLRRHRDAEGLLREALGLARGLGDRHVESSALLGVALVQLETGALTDCDETARQTLSLAQEIGNPHGQAWAMIALGLAHCYAGAHQEGTEWHRRAADLAHRLGEPHTESMALNGIGHGFTHLARHEEAERHLRAALGLRLRVRDRHGEAETRTDLAALLNAVQRPEEARDEAERARSIYARILPPGTVAPPLPLLAGRGPKPR
ncbi:BTAD domain-containing putative transcriptional regulator [Streptomyces sp. NPDC005865]|uniref:BTAD domain-containing putative transcriptional regulator n=1 Tax=Streptomyces sp. NPDC005865 TaxID=3155453 RepID=UPI0033F84B59